MKKCLVLVAVLAVSSSAVADQELVNAATAGDAVAQFMGAMGLLDLAESEPEHAESAVFWLRQAADQGLAIAQGMLGALYRDGFGPIEQDSAEAVHWFRLAADQGLAMAQTALASMYVRGDGVPEDTARAVYWYRRAAERGSTAAQIMLVKHYHIGEGVPKDVVRAYAWLTVAAAHDADAEVGGERVAVVRDEYAAQILTTGQLAEGTRLANELWNRIGSRHPLMIQTPHPSGAARELRIRVLAALRVDADVPPEPFEFKTWEHQLAPVFRRLLPTPSAGR